MTALGLYLAKRTVNKAEVSRRTGISKSRLTQLTANDSAKLRADELYLIALAINADPGEQQKFYANREDFEREKNARGGARSAPGPSGRQTVKVPSSSMTDSRKFVGYLWPTAYWRAHISSTMHMGRKVSGVWET
jgi:putative transcriptional regulator